MGGPNLEIFKFSLYLFVPLAALVHFGDPQWYRDVVVPYRKKLFPQADHTPTLPTNQQAVREELARIKAERMLRRAQLEAESSKDSK
ncbi:hypothetical protein BJ165DRAFT_1532814 [Panaeolus papilionaceus]|nr:hypothetical protein BJ165DRAFT_1532814 [Panaeolus papilionaceus]